MNDPVQWPNAALHWSADGYQLSLTIWLDQRASALFERQLPDALRSFEELGDQGGTNWEFEPGRIARGRDGASAEPAVLTITAPRTLFAIEPAKLLALGELAAECRRKADEQHERDEAIAAEWLKRVRELGT